MMTGKRFAVVRSSTPGRWGAYLNGSLLGTNHYVGYDTGYALAGGERQGSWVPVTGCWGCGGGVSWQYTTTGGASYSTIGSGARTYGDGSWFIQLPPSPFQIHD